MELGGAWTLGTPTYPIVVPPLTRDEATRKIGNIQMGELSTDAEISGIFDELHGRLTQILSIQISLTSWNRAIGDFKQQLPSKLATAQSAAATARSRSNTGSNAGLIIAKKAKGDKVTIDNISMVAGQRGNELYGEATNHDKAEHTTSIMATFYDTKGKIAGTSTAMVSQLGPGGTKTFRITDVPDHARSKVEVDLVL
jgi:hypothetical protein